MQDAAELVKLPRSAYAHIPVGQALLSSKPAIDALRSSAASYVILNNARDY